MTETLNGEWELFQFTPLREGRLSTSARAIWRSISIHAPPRGATTGGFVTDDDGTFQFTPLREGRRKTSVFVVVLIHISIHAPPRGATFLLDLKAYRLPYFNSRPSARGDRFPRTHGERHEISIHAPPRGATATWSVVSVPA